MQLKNHSENIPEIDLIIGTGEYHKITMLLRAFEEGRLTKKSFVEIPKYFVHQDALKLRISKI